MLKKLLSVITLIIILSSASFAVLKITAIEQENSKFDVVLNDSIKIVGISLKNNKTDIDLPVYVNNGKIYKQFGILKRDFRTYLTDSIVNNTVVKNKDQITFKINKFNIVKNHKTIKAFCSFILDDTLEVECRIMNSQYGLWLAIPTSKQNNKWINNLIFLNPKLKNDIEFALLEKYVNEIQN